MKKEKISTLEVDDMRSGRGEGNTLRQVDFAIDRLYKGYIIKAEDHHLDGLNGKANVYLFDRIIKRLELEHNLRYLFATDKIRLDKYQLEIEFL